MVEPLIDDPLVGFLVVMAAFVLVAVVSMKAGEYYGRSQENLRQIDERIEAIQEDVDDGS